MDIYNFINSRDVAAYCRETGKVWTPFDMAVIIDRSNCSMSEKHAGWRAIIADYPDMPTKNNIHYHSYDSLHQKLAEVIDYQERVLALFKKPEPNAVYQYKVWRHDEYEHSYSVFTTFEKAFSDARDLWTRDEAHEFVFEKVFADDNGRIENRTDYDGNSYSIDIIGIRADMLPDVDYDNLLDDLGDLFYVDIPVPFERGDILIFRNNRYTQTDDDHIFMLDSAGRDNPEIQERRLRGEMSDGTDLMCCGYFVDKDGLLYWNHSGMYDFCEYYKGKLEGKNRTLHYASLFIQDKIKLEDLLTMQCRIILEHKLENDMRTDTHSCYIPTHLHAENRLSAAEKEQIEQDNRVMPWLEGKLSIHQVEFLAKEFGVSDKAALQIQLGYGGGSYLGPCAGIVHDENHYEETNDGRFNHARRAMAKLFLESYDYTEAGWVNKYEKSEEL